MLSNAVKFSENNKHVCLDILTEGEDITMLSVLIKCRDFGPGIEAADLANLFKPYSNQTNTNDSHGLGLFVCKRIAENLNGKLTVKSKVKEGCEFTFSFKAELLEPDIQE